MVKIEGIDTLNKELEKRIRESKRNDMGSVIVGYSTNYAVFVHENLEMKLMGQPRKGKGSKGNYWDPPGRGQSKFLEQPARELKNVLRDIIVTAVENGASVVKAMMIAGNRLQRESQLLVPVDKTPLKVSAFTRREK